MNTPDLEYFRIDLALPLLIIKAPKGMLACAYLDICTFNKTGEAAAIVSGVNDFDDMRSAIIIGVSKEASALGINVGETGQAALDLMM